MKIMPRNICYTPRARTRYSVAERPLMALRCLPIRVNGCCGPSTKNHFLTKDSVHPGKNEKEGGKKTFSFLFFDVRDERKPKDVLLYGKGGGRPRIYNEAT